MSDEQAVDDIKELLAHEFMDYGHLKMTYWLRKMKGYIINDKKVYRLMKG
ncbi:MAG: transposase [Saprospiraceae bacterium]